jgi:hypothetical protein
VPSIAIISDFKSLKSKPLWEFKEHDHRLYCFRKQQGSRVDIILFNGWIKDKAGKSIEEGRHIGTALAYYAEYIAELLEGKTS